MFLLISTYSVFVNVLGAMTTILVPPKSEAISFADPIPYTYEYNWQLLTKDNLNSSLFYDSYFSDHMSSLGYAMLYTAVVMFFMITIYLFLLRGSGNVSAEEIAERNKI